jgi:hypothetical protein
MLPSVILTRDPLQILKVDAIGYGAKDTGGTGGGAAAAIGNPLRAGSLSRSRSTV